MISSNDACGGNLDRKYSDAMMGILAKLFSLIFVNVCKSAVLDCLLHYNVTQCHSLASVKVHHICLLIRAFTASEMEQ